MKLKWNYFAYDDMELEKAFSLSLTMKRIKIVRTWLVFVLVFVIVRSILLLSYNEERTVSNIVLFIFWVTLPLSILIGSYFILPTYASLIGTLSHLFFYTILVLAVVSLLLDKRNENEPASFIGTTAIIWVSVPFTATLLIHIDMIGTIISSLSSFFVVMYLFSQLDALASESNRTFVSSRSLVLVPGFVSFFLLFIVSDVDVMMMMIQAAVLHGQQLRSTFIARKKLIEEHDARTAEQSAVTVARQKMEFISQVAHDIGTPLQALSLCIDELRGTSLTYHQIGLVDDQVTAMELMISTRDKALSYAKADNQGTFTPTIACVDMKKMLQKCRRVMELYMVNKSVRMSVQVQKSLLDADGNVFILSDSEFLRDMLLNYLSNAAKFTDKGEIRVSIFLTDDSYLRFEVRDTGIGVPDADKERLFSAFTQLQATTGDSNDIATCAKTMDPSWFSDIESPSAAGSSAAQPTDPTSTRSLQKLVSNASQSVSTLLRMSTKKTTIDIETGLNDNDSPPSQTPTSRQRPKRMSSRKSAPPKSGTGLGLFGVKVKATALGGSVGVEDNTPNGSVFYFTVPFKACDEKGQVIRDSYAENVNIMADDTSSSLKIASSRNYFRRSPSFGPVKRKKEKDDDSMMNEFRYVEIFCPKPPDSPMLADEKKQPLAMKREQVKSQALVVSQPGEVLLGSDSSIELKQTAAGVVLLDVKPIRIIKQSSRPKLTIDTPNTNAATTAESKAAAVKVASSSLPVSTSSPKSPEVLLVEDSSSVRLMMVKSLRRRNIVVDEAEDGQIGLDKIKARMYDIAIFDNYMPNLNGIDAVVQFRQWEEEQFKAGLRTRRQRLAMMTGAIDDEFIEEATASGAECVLSKPTPVDKLMELINKPSN